MKIGFRLRPPPPLTPPLKGEGYLEVLPLLKSGQIRSALTTPSPLRGGVRGGGRYEDMTPEDQA